MYQHVFLSSHSMHRSLTVAACAAGINSSSIFQPRLLFKAQQNPSGWCVWNRKKQIFPWQSSEEIDPLRRSIAGLIEGQKHTDIQTHNTHTHTHTHTHTPKAVAVCTRVCVCVPAYVRTCVRVSLKCYLSVTHLPFIISKMSGTPIFPHQPLDSLSSNVSKHLRSERNGFIVCQRVHIWEIRSWSCSDKHVVSITLAVYLNAPEKHFFFFFLFFFTGFSLQFQRFRVKCNAVR